MSVSVLRSRRLAGTLAGALLAAASLVACSSESGPQDTVDAFIEGWRAGRLDAIGFVTPAGQRIAAAEVVEQIRELSGDLADTPPALRTQADPTTNGSSADATIAVDWTLPNGTHWAYDSRMQLVRGPDDAWQVIWQPAIVQPKLTDGDRLTVRRLPAVRAAVLDGSGKPIVAPRPVVVVGVEPRAVDDVPTLVRQLDTAFRAIRPRLNPPIDLSDLPQRLASAKPDAFVEVVTLRQEAYQQVKPRIHGLASTRFRDEQRDLAPTREFARALLGSVDPAQKADLEARPGVYAQGDLVGHGGLQGGYEDRLRGVPGVAVSISRKGPEGTYEPTGTDVFRDNPRRGTPLRTTLDVPTQVAADAALADEPRRSALVAVRISDGAVLAAANGPDGGGENLAFTAQVPPGSTFKMVSTLGLLDAGAVSPQTPVACPAEHTVQGRRFTNADGFELGTVAFRVDFAKSCNTAFAALAPKLGADGLAVAGRSLGLEGDWQVGAEAFTGRISTGGSDVERAAAAFGQGTTTVSPLAMAAATAAVARGRWRAPRLVTEPAPPTPTADGPALKPTSVQPLRDMMREVVTAGSATALADVPGGPVHGKTGTAEYGAKTPPDAHAWFVGWQGDIAFAVFVEGGQSGSAVAVPAVERFLRGLAGR